LRCLWCHNPESHSAELETHEVKRKIDGKEISMAREYGSEVSDEDILTEILQDKVFYDESGGGVTFSGGEPLMQHKALIKLLEIAGEKGIHRTVDTSGYASEKVISEVAEHTDLFLYDLKNMDPNKHKDYTGVDNRKILENADSLLEMGKEVIFRVPLIPGINDGEEELMAYTHFFEKRADKFKEVHILPYHKTGSDKYRRLDLEYALRELMEPTQEQVNIVKQKFETTGLKVIIGG
jgi:pyruvate formate lyase activating enzyme